MSWTEIKRLFEAASDLPAAERRAFLDAECPPDLRAEVDALLIADEGETAFMEAPAAEGVGLELGGQTVELATGQRIGPYKLLTELGRGGMGVVYLAERADGTYTQRVALKLVRADAAQLSSSRFRAERQILARLAHPNIARLLDGGLSDPVPGAPDGLPYLVMEYVAGEPLTQYADRRRLSVKDRLTLFQQACEAVAFAHQNLVVHRDLKPGNILVEQTDEGPGRVKLLDFGIAKLLDETEEDQPFITRTSAGLMTPAYAAPEQVRGTGVTTATDIYALGVILYELLTGRRPYDTGGLSPAELERVICGTEPSRPSTMATRVVDSDATRPVTPAELAGMRSTEPSALASTLSGDLDAIILKALSKEASRRYAAAGELGEEVRRHLRGEPVEAREPTWGYRASRFVRRNTAAVAAGAAVLALLIGLAGVSTYAAVTVAEERDRAQLEADKATQTVDFLSEMLGAANPEVQGRDVTVRALLDSAVVRLDTAFTDQLDVRASVLHAVGQSYVGLGRYQDAVPLLQECRELLGAADPSRLEANCLTQLGYALSEGGALEAGLEVELQALEVERALAGTDSTQGISTMYNNIATSYYTLGEFEKADSLYRRALAIDEHRLPDHHSTLAKAYGSLGSTNSVLGRYDEAVEFYRKAVEVLARGDTTAQYVTNVLYSLANTELAMGDFDAAQRTFDRLLAGRRLLLGPDHPNTLMTEGAYGGLMFEQGKIQEAKAWFEDVLQRKAEVFGTAHPRYANSMSRLALVELAAGEPSAALRHAREAQQTWSEVLPDHYVHGRIWTILGDILAATDQTEDAIDAYRTGLGYLQPTLPERHMLVADAQLGLARALQTAGTAPAEADSLEQAGRATLIDLHGLEHPRTRRMLRGT